MNQGILTVEKQTFLNIFQHINQQTKQLLLFINLNSYSSCKHIDKI